MGKMRWQDEDQEGVQSDQLKEQDLSGQIEQELEDPSFQDQDLQDGFTGQDEQTMAVMDEAVLRIEQANLYQTLLNHNLFAKGSARPEIIQKVQAEVRTFILSRLKVLLGIEQEQVPQDPVQVELPFDEDQIAFLQRLADRGLGRIQLAPVARPILNQVQSSPATAPEAVQAPTQPALNPVQAPRQQPPKKSAPQRRQAPPPEVPQGDVVEYKGVKVRARKQSPNPRRQRSLNLSEVDGKDLSQAVNPRNPPKPMPPQAVIDQMNATQVANLTQSTQGGQEINMAGLVAAKLIGGR